MSHQAAAEHEHEAEGSLTTKTELIGRCGPTALSPGQDLLEVRNTKSGPLLFLHASHFTKRFLKDVLGQSNGTLLHLGSAPDFSVFV